MVYGYARISTSNQANGNGLECQERELRAAGADEIISEQYSGYKMNRPKFSALVKLLKSGDTLIVTKLDRFARTAAEGAVCIDDLVSRGVRKYTQHGNSGQFAYGQAYDNDSACVLGV